MSGTKTTGKKVPRVKQIKRKVVPSLDDSKNHLDLKSFHHFEFLLLVSSNTGSKAIVLDEDTLRMVNYLTSFQELEKYGVNKIFITKQDHIDQKDPNKKETDIYIFFIRSKISTVNLVCKQIKNIKIRKKIIVYLIPRKLKIIERIFEQKGVYSKISLIHSFAFDFLPIDTNFFSCALSNSYKELELNGNVDLLYLYARCIVKFESFYGRFFRKYFIGKRGKEVLQIVKSLYKDLQDVPITSVENNLYGFNELIIFDRNVDLITPFVTPLAFEGLVNSYYTIKESGVFDFKQMPNKERAKHKVILNDDDEIFRRVRNFDINEIGSQLKMIANECKEFEKKENYDELSKMKDLIQKLPKYKLKKQSLNDHITIAGELRVNFSKLKKIVETERTILHEKKGKEIVDFIENLIIKNEKIEKVLKFITLYSIVNNGIKKKDLDFLKKEMIHSYGIETMLIFKDLEELNLVKEKDKKRKKNRTFSLLKKKLGLFNDDKNIISKGIHYVFGGFSALSVSIIQEFIKNSESFKNIKKENLLVSSENDRLVDLNESPKKLKVLLFFIGGITRAELISIRKIEKTNHNLEFIVMSPEICSNFMEQFCKVL